MKLDKKTIIILSVLAAVILLLVVTSPAQKKAAAAASAAVSINKGEFTALMADLNTKQVFEHANWGSKNPFDSTVVVVAGAAAGVEGELVLIGTFLGGKPSAIINHVVVGLGDKIGESTVKKIQHHSVTLINAEGQDQVLTLKIVLKSSQEQAAEDAAKAAAAKIKNKK